jgi:hypothetical protein
MGEVIEENSLAGWSLAGNSPSISKCDVVKIEEKLLTVRHLRCRELEVASIKQWLGAPRSRFENKMTIIQQPTGDTQCSLIGNLGGETPQMTKS